MMRLGLVEEPTVPGFHLFDNSRDVEDVAAGEVVFEQGEFGDAMFAILDGSIDIIRDGEVQFTAGEGDVVGEMALIDDAPRSATAQARTPARLVAVDRDRFTFLVQEHPTFALQVMSSMANKLRGQQ